MSRTRLVAALLFGSGFCALVYQSVWLRELRLVFGASTPASAAVLAIFLGGLGFGGLVLGRRADASSSPLGLYARLELSIALGAALTPLLIDLAARLYLASGGSPALGIGLATGLRLVLATLVLGATTFLMGGTLPAASRAVESDDDPGRRRVAVLYGVNTLGGMAGVLLPTFLLFERFGIRPTLEAAALLNAAIALVAWRMSRRGAPAGRRVAPVAAAPAAVPRPDPAARPAAPVGFVLAAATIVGGAFLLMELVWYRMLAPILGGSTYTFGLILALVLFGIGSGGVLYALLGRRRGAGLGAFAITCTAEAALLVAPYALGDRIAAWAVLLQPAEAAGFGARVAAWTAIGALVVVPGAVVAGWQFPLLIALLGRGRTAVGRHVGLGYAWNTIGAIAGSLAGGFGLMQALGAPGTWRAVAWMLLALGGVSAVLARRVERGALRPAVAGVLLVAALLGTGARGPTAAWRHAPIGAGRVHLEDTSPNGLRAWMNQTRRTTLWEAEGRESSVALQSTLGLSFVINGKSDGNARYDAPTQVMYGLVGAALHPRPERALVVGLGTGSTAGWLAAVPTITRVDVAELEPAILDVARACAPVNRDALASPKVRVFLGDGREMLLTARDRYDVIASEPSNPYRAGVASLFTREFYRAVRSRLGERGIFLQWVQAYEVDERTIRTIYATLGAVFDEVETWQTGVGDLLLVCATAPIEWDAAPLRARLAREPYRTAMAATWRVLDLEGFLARRVGGPALARDEARAADGRINTDDRPLVEFGFARSLGRTGLFRIETLRDRARALGCDGVPFPATRANGVDAAVAVDPAVVEDRRLSLHVLEERTPPIPPGLGADGVRRAAIRTDWLRGDYADALARWTPPAEPEAAQDLVAVAIAADLLATAGRPDAAAWIAALRRHEPVEADVLEAILVGRRGDRDGAVHRLAGAFTGYRTDPWPWPPVMERALGVARGLAAEDPAAASVLFESLLEPFAVRQLDYQRLTTAMEIAKVLGPEAIVRTFERFEPDFLWTEPMLAARARLYRETGHPAAERAEAELEEFRRAAGH